MITLVCGPMHSGKTTEMLRRLERAHIGKKNTILIRPSSDTRGFLSHSGVKYNWLREIFVDSLKDVEICDCDYIGIDEGQFHNGLKDFCIKFGHKNIIISALHATSECEMFDQIIDIIPYCDKIIKLNAVCTDCGSEFGNYTHYLAGVKTDKIKVGGSESYTSLCRNCYNYKKTGPNGWQIF